MTVNRRQFLRSFANRREEIIRPPWALPESRFVDTCSRCSACVEICPERIIKRGSGGFPEIDFHQNGCNFCGKCVTVCRDGALQKQPDQLPWRRAAVVAQSCISLHGVTCRACGDYCNEQAILFKIESRGVARPIVDETKCTGCGYCVKPCPVDAVKIKEMTEDE